MADIQVLPILFSTKDHSKNKTTSSSTARNCLPKRPLQVSDTIRMLVLTSRLPRKPSNLTTSIRNALLLVELVLEVRFSKESSSLPRCKGLLLSAETTCIMSPSTTDMRNDTETSLLIAPPPSTSKKEILSSLENADLSVKPYASTSSRSLLMR